MPIAITNQIQIEVETFYNGEQPDEGRICRMFAYRICISNLGDYTVKLLRRHWTIIDPLYEDLEVEGEGVVGQQPVLEPGEVFRYTSGCAIESTIGMMKGTYQMERILDGKIIEVEIPAFNLIAPYQLN
jgi:ApaG protein